MKKLLALMAFLPMIAQAGVYLEPYVGYGIGSGESTGYGVPYKFDSTGTGYGMRAGGSLLGLIGGYEYSAMSLDVDFKDSSVDDVTVDMTLHGLFAGYQFPSVIPVLGKVWGTYYFAGEDKNDGTKTKLDNGYALGLGLAPIPVPLPFLSLHFNIEYRHYENKKDSDGDNSKFDTYLLSVSLPINI